jgi:hypothetical protein
VVLPEFERAEIDPQKLHGYLLSSSHPIGRFKARFFAALGFTADRWQELEVALRVQHLTQDAKLSRAGAHGQTHTIRAILNGPSGQGAVVTSVWFIPKGRTVPRFVTAYPGDTL